MWESLFPEFLNPSEFHDAIFRRSPGRVGVAEAMVDQCRGLTARIVFLDLQDPTFKLLQFLSFRSTLKVQMFISAAYWGSKVFV